MTRFLGKIQAPWADGFPSGDGWQFAEAMAHRFIFDLPTLRMVIFQFANFKRLPEGNVGKKKCHKPSPSHHHFYRSYGYHSHMAGVWHCFNHITIYFPIRLSIWVTFTSDCIIVFTNH
jgi:hypothetical protein